MTLLTDCLDAKPKESRLRVLVNVLPDMEQDNEDDEDSSLRRKLIEKCEKTGVAIDLNCSSLPNGVL